MIMIMAIRLSLVDPLKRTLYYTIILHKTYEQNLQKIFLVGKSEMLV